MAGEKVKVQTSTSIPRNIVPEIKVGVARTDGHTEGALKAGIHLPLFPYRLKDSDWKLSVPLLFHFAQGSKDSSIDGATSRQRDIGGEIGTEARYQFAPAWALLMGVNLLITRISTPCDPRFSESDQEAINTAGEGGRGFMSNNYDTRAGDCGREATYSGRTAVLPREGLSVNLGLRTGLNYRFAKNVSAGVEAAWYPVQRSEVDGHNPDEDAPITQSSLGSFETLASLRFHWDKVLETAKSKEAEKTTQAGTLTEPPVPESLAVKNPESGTVLQATEGEESKFTFTLNKVGSVSVVATKDSGGEVILSTEAANKQNFDVAFTPPAPGNYTLVLTESGATGKQIATYTVVAAMSEATLKAIDAALAASTTDAKKLEKLEELARMLRDLNDERAKEKKFAVLAARLKQVNGVKEVNANDQLWRISFVAPHPNAPGGGSLKGSLDDVTLKILEVIAAVLTPDSFVPGVESMQIIGHTDASGGAENNRRISKMRADLAKQHLEAKQEALKGKIESGGRGEDDIDKLNLPRTSKARNDKNLKRLEFVLTPQLVKSAAEPPSPPAAAPTPAPAPGTAAGVPADLETKKGPLTPPATAPAAAPKKPTASDLFDTELAPEEVKK